MSYSNIGPAIAGYAIEQATGELFEDFVDREIFNVIGMGHASFRYDANVAESYKADGLTAEPYTHLLDRPSGSLSATALDMADLLAMFIDRGRIDDRQLIRASSLSRMERSETTLTSDRELTGGLTASVISALRWMVLSIRGTMGASTVSFQRMATCRPKTGAISFRSMRLMATRTKPLMLRFVVF